MQKGITTRCHHYKLRLEYDDVALPMNELKSDEATGRLLCSNDLELRDRYGVHGLRAESADLLHRRMGHIIQKIVDVLRNQGVNGVEYNGDIKNMCCLRRRKK